MTEDVIGNFMARKALTELTPAALRAAKVNSGAFFKNLWAGAQYQGKLFGVPQSSSAMVMFYNEGLMQKMGVAGVPKNRAQFLAAAQKRTTDTAGKHPGESGFNPNNLQTYGAGMVLPWSGGTLAYGVLRSNGGDLVNKNFDAAFNSPEAVEAVQFLVDLSGKYHVSPPRLAEESDVNTFKAGNNCFNFQGVWQLTGYKAAPGLNFGIAPLPRLGTKQDASWGAAVHLVLPVQRANYDRNKRNAALEFVRWMTLPEQNLYWTTSGALPTQQAVANDKGYATNPMAQINEGLENLFVPTGFPWVAQVRGAWDSAVEAALLGKKSPKQALDDAVSEANKQVAQARQNLGAK